MDSGTLRKRAEKARVTTLVHHVLVCVDDDCDEKGRITKRIKKGIAAAGLRSQVATTKVKCLDICKGGPVVVVYPEGTWYAGVTPAVADRIVAEHLGEGRPVQEHSFVRRPLGGCAAGTGSCGADAPGGATHG